MAYWDTSALAKLYTPEPDSQYFSQLVADGDLTVDSAAIAAIEILCVLYRKEQGGELRTGVAERLYRKFVSDVDAGRVMIIPYGRDVQGEAEKLVRLVVKRPRPLLLRSLDTIHVATALSNRESVIVATDPRLRGVAALAGLRLLP